MGSYAVYDLSESMRSVPADFIPVRVAEAWGGGGDYAEWSGGFLLESADGRWGYLTGWCDMTGWGCQDGTEWYPFDHRPTHAEIAEAVKPDGFTADRDDEWDPDPADLNKWLSVGMPQAYTAEWDRLMGGVAS